VFSGSVLFTFFNLWEERDRHNLCSILLEEVT